MANYHALDGDTKGGGVTIAFHIPVPNDDNVAGTSTLRQAIVDDPDQRTDSRVPGIESAEQTQLTAGELLEVVKFIRFPPGTSLVEIRNKVDAEYQFLTSDTVNNLRYKYALWGFERTVP